jgi:predicted metal-dependent HD superfamily phosphohydrolase
MSPAAAPDLSDPERFRSLWRRCLIEGARDDSAAIHRRLLERYRESWRYYHTLEHIEHCIGWFDSCSSLVRYPDPLELAVWFHDAIWEPGNPDNEALSAEFYLEFSDGVHEPAVREQVEWLIMATLHLGSSIDADDDARYMVDIDLSSFGLPWKDFLRDSENLRREANLDDETYFEKARTFHRSLLDRERFYYTEFFAARLEARARDNIRRYLERIGD